MLLKCKRSIALIVILSLLFSMNAFAAENTPDNGFEQELDANVAAMIDELFGVSIAEGMQKYHLSKENNVALRSYAAQGEVAIVMNENVTFVGAFTQKPDIAMCACSPEEAYQRCLETLPMLEDLFQFEHDCELSEGIVVSDDYIMFTASRRMENGVMNDLQSLKIFFDMRYGKYALVNAFNETPNTLIQEVAAEDAVTIAYGCISDRLAVESCELKYVDRSIYLLDEYDQHECILAYYITFEDGEIVVIDALSGTIIGNDMIMSEQAQCFAIQDSPFSGDWGYNSSWSAEKIAVYNGFRYNDILRAQSGFSTLGYNVTKAETYNNNDMYDDIEDFIQLSGNGYGMYINGHGTSSSIGFYNYPVLTTSSFSNFGNWHFVYLDGCNTGANTSWANAFHIYGYSNRAFLGWSNIVTLANSTTFNYHLWQLLNGNNYVQYSAVTAASQVPGSGTTPTRFYGDIYYKGTAWS